MGCGFFTLSLYAALVAVAGRIGAGKKWEVINRGIGGWRFVIGLLAVHVIYASRIVTRIFLTTKGTTDTKTRHWMGWLLWVHRGLWFNCFPNRMLIAG